MTTMSTRPAYRHLRPNITQNVATTSATIMIDRGGVASNAKLARLSATSRA